jgi:NAD(P)-dependent dehydrogenase (short-subunit alcohol dehydrogenase family)
MSKKDSGKRTVIITGGNSGLGYECAKNIARDSDDNYIVLACRNSEKTRAAVKSLIEETGNDNIAALEIDLSSLESVRNFVKAFLNSDFPSLYAVVCNAGVQIVKGTRYTEDGFEMTFGVNHLAHFLLVNMLLGAIGDKGRIVIVSSDTHDPMQKTGMPRPVYDKAEFLAYPDRGKAVLSGTERYTTSKLCNVYCAYGLADRIKAQANKRITVNAFNPGLMPGTGLARDYNIFFRFMWNHILPVLTLFIKSVNTVQKSGRALASLVTDGEFENITGKYFDGTKQISSSELSYSKENSDDLWRTSAELIRLKRNETILEPD